eukprot:857630-Pelagomonas_calceolata.AAC.1
MAAQPPGDGLWGLLKSFGKKPLPTSGAYTFSISCTIQGTSGAHLELAVYQRSNKTNKARMAVHAERAQSAGVLL